MAKKFPQAKPQGKKLPDVSLTWWEKAATGQETLQKKAAAILAAYQKKVSADFRTVAPKNPSSPLEKLAWAYTLTGCVHNKVGAFLNTSLKTLDPRAQPTVADWVLDEKPRLYLTMDDACELSPAMRFVLFAELLDAAETSFAAVENIFADPSPDPSTFATCPGTSYHHAFLSWCRKIRTRFYGACLRQIPDSQAEKHAWKASKYSDFKTSVVATGMTYEAIREAWQKLHTEGLYDPRAYRQLPVRLLKEYRRAESATEKAKAASKPKITKGKANAKALEYLPSHPTAKARELADAIGCAVGLVADLPAWRAVMKARNKGKTPKAVPLSEAIMHTVPDAKAELARLMREQEPDDRETNPEKPRLKFLPRRTP